jgi:hypothetical protein
MMQGGGVPLPCRGGSKHGFGSVLRNLNGSWTHLKTWEKTMKPMAGLTGRIARCGSVWLACGIKTQKPKIDRLAAGRISPDSLGRSSDLAAGNRKKQRCWTIGKRHVGMNGGNKRRDPQARNTAKGAKSQERRRIENEVDPAQSWQAGKNG